MEEPSDFHTEEQVLGNYLTDNELKRYLKLKKKNKPVYKCLRLPPSGNGEHHESLFLQMKKALDAGIAPDPLDPCFNDYVGYMVKQYEEDGTKYEGQGQKQVEEVVKKLYRSERDFSRSTQQQHFPKRDDVFLESFDKVKLSSLVEGTDEIPISPFKWVTTMFNEKVLDGGFICSVEEANHYCCNWANRKGSFPVNPLDQNKSLKPSDINGHNFLCFSVSQRHTTEIGPDEKHRSKDNVKSTPYLVFEFDDKDHVKQRHFYGFISKMKQFAPLVSAVYSGNKSVHFWFALGRQKPSDVSAFTREAARAGADTTVLKDTSKLVRMANVESREIGRKRQSLLFFDSTLTDPDNVPKWDESGFLSSIDENSQMEVYYNNQKYYLKTKHKTFQSLTDTEMRRYLVGKGYHPTKSSPEQLQSDVDTELNRIREEYGVDAIVDRCSGYSQGRFFAEDMVDEGSYVGSEMTSTLILKGPAWHKVVNEECKDKFPTIKKFLRKLFGEEQYEYFVAWLAHGAKCAYNDGKPISKFEQSQYLNIIGDAGTGKSLMINHIVLPVLGGAGGLPAKADPLFDTSGNANFTSALFASPLLLLDDTKVLRSTKESREHQGETVKELLVGQAPLYNKKYGQQVSIRPFWRLIRSLNWGKIDTLPIYHSEGIADKCIMLCVDEKLKEMNSDHAKELISHWRKEMPYFFTFLLHEHVTPNEIKGERFATKAYWSPRVLQDVAPDTIGEQFAKAIRNIRQEIDIDAGWDKNVEGVDYFISTPSLLQRSFYEKKSNHELYSMFSTMRTLKKAVRDALNEGLIVSDGNLLKKDENGFVLDEDGNKQNYPKILPRESSKGNTIGIILEQTDENNPFD